MVLTKLNQTCMHHLRYESSRRFAEKSIWWFRFDMYKTTEQPILEWVQGTNTTRCFVCLQISTLVSSSSWNALRIGVDTVVECVDLFSCSPLWKPLRSSCEVDQIQFPGGLSETRLMWSLCLLPPIVAFFIQKNRKCWPCFGTHHKNWFKSHHNAETLRRVS